MSLNKMDFKLKLPSKKDEKWRYSDLSLLELPIKKSVQFIGDIDSYIQDDQFCYLVIINGKYSKKKSTLPKSCIDISYQDNIHYGSEFGSKFQVLQNMQNNHHMIVININKDIDKPIKLLQCFSSTSSFSSIHIKLDQNCRIKLFECFVQQGEQNFFSNSIIKINLCSNASCKHFFQKDFERSPKSIYTLEVDCDANAHYENYSVNVQEQSFRFESDVHLNGQGSSVNFYGVCIAKNNKIFDFVCNINHNTSRTFSSQCYNQVLDNNSVGSFYSNVFIPKFLKNIEAHQLNKNLIIDEASKAYSRPMLDINSDDVICSHGSTIGNIDQDVLNYFASRGMKCTQAKNFIILGLLKSVFSECPLENDEIKILHTQIDNAL